MAGAQRAGGTLRLFVLVGVGFLFLFQLAAFLDAPRRLQVILGLYGFIFHVIFGKAYALIPAYFDRQLAWPWAPRVHLVVAVTGTIGLAYGSMTPSVLGAIGAILWALGVACFVGTIGWTIRDNFSGRATGTGEANRDRRRLDRIANAFIPIALGYLVLGTYGTVALSTTLPSIIDQNPVRVSHLLAAGTGGLLVFAVGIRLLPRLFVATPPLSIVLIMLVAGAIGPAVLAIALWSPPWFLIGAVLQTLAVLGYVGVVGSLFVETDRSRVGQAAIGVGALSGLLAVIIGLEFALGSTDTALVIVHYRVVLVGFLGLTIVGVLFHLYPPAVGDLPGTGERLGRMTIGLLVGGLALEAVGVIAGVSQAIPIGRVLGIVGAVALMYLMASIVHARGLR